jgi:RHS repeat-associated protein
VQENAFYPFGLPIPGLSWGTASNSPNRYMRESKEYITDHGWNRLDYHARTYNPATGLFDRRDPLSALFPHVGSYVAFLNNPLRIIDPTGMEAEAAAMVADTDYGVTSAGYISRITEHDDKPDKLFVLNNDGSINTDVNPITVNDKSILSSLSENTPVKVATGFCAESGTIVESFNLSIFSAKNNVNEKTATEMKNLFYFLSDNSSKAEWRLHQTKQGAFGLGTFHATHDAPSDKHFGLSSKDIQWMIHSHTDSKRSIAAERTGLAADRAYAQFYPLFQVYIPSSRRIYTIDKYGRDTYRTR